MKHSRFNFFLSLIALILLSIYIPLTWAQNRFDDFSIEIPQIQNFEDFDIVTIKSRTVDLPAKNKDHQFGKNTIIEDQFFFIPKNGYVTEITSEVVGAPSQEVIHHSALLNSLGKKDFMCPEIPEFVYMTDEYLSPFAPPNGYGYQIKPPKNLYYLFTHFRNDLNTDFKNVYLKLTLKISKNKQQPLETIRLDGHNNSCDKFSSFPILANSHKEITMKEPLESPYSGKVIFIAGHFHDYSDHLKILKNGQEVLNFKPVFSSNNNSRSDLKSENHIEKIPPISPDNLYFQKGDKITLLTEYFNPTDMPIEAMVLALAYIAVSK